MEEKSREEQKAVLDMLPRAKGLSLSAWAGKAGVNRHTISNNQDGKANLTRQHSGSCLTSWALRFMSCRNNCHLTFLSRRTSLAFIHEKSMVTSGPTQAVVPSVAAASHYIWCARRPNVLYPR